jgi:hypothetical protein
MTTSIVQNDLHNYTELRDAIQNIRYMIFKGKPEGNSESTAFTTNFNLLFPDNINTTPYSNKLICSGHGTTTAPSNTDFKNLLHNSLYPLLHQTHHVGTSTTTIKNDHFTSGATTKDHLCFFKFDAATFTNILPDQYAIDNILYSIFIMEIFIKIIDALKDCYKNDKTYFDTSYTSSTNIFIVERKLKQHHDINTPKGIFINNTSSPGHSTPANGIYLYIGDLNNLFNPNNITTIKCTTSGNTANVGDNTTVIPHGTANTHDNRVYTFDESNKLVHKNADMSEYYFNYLKIYEVVTAQTTVVSLNSAVGATYNSASTHYYKFNIEKVFNFINVIKNIKKDSFLPTINYLHIYLLSFKSALLSSVRAANIFFNNKYVLNAIAISYEKNFLNNNANTPGETSCSPLGFNNFIKNMNTANPNTTANTCDSTYKLPFDTSLNTKEYKFLLYRTLPSGKDNADVFKKYDKYLHDEIENTSSPAIDSSSSELGIQYYTLFKDNYKIDGDYIIYNHDNHIENGSILDITMSTNKTEYEAIKNMFILNKTNDFNKYYRIKIGDDDNGYKVLNFTTYNNLNGKKCVKIILQKNNNVYDSSNKLIDDTTTNKVRNHNVYISKITAEDLRNDYEKIISYTNNTEQNINMYKSKIKNASTLYDLYKSKNNLLFNQMISYIIIVIIVIAVLIIINIGGVEKSLIKSISLVCLGVIIVLIMSYYIMNTLYIEEGFQNSLYIEEGFQNSYYPGFELCPSSHRCISVKEPTTYNKKKENENDILIHKKNNVVSYLNSNAAKLIILTNLIKPKIVNDSLKDTGDILLMLSKNTYNEKKHINDVLINKKHDSDMNIDVIRYDNKNYDTYIVCILILALIIISTYTINLYTDDKYLDLLLLIVMIMVICLFTYFILYTNRIVRTVSSNYYWGSEYKDEYI